MNDLHCMLSKMFPAVVCSLQKYQSIIRRTLEIDYLSLWWKAQHSCFGHEMVRVSSKYVLVADGTSALTQ